MYVACTIPLLSKVQNVQKRDSGTGTRTLVSCVKGKYANHLHHTGACAMSGFIIYQLTFFFNHFLAFTLTLSSLNLSSEAWTLLMQIRLPYLIHASHYVHDKRRRSERSQETAGSARCCRRRRTHVGVIGGRSSSAKCIH